MKSNFEEYMNFFEKWLYYQFPKVESDWENHDILKKVAKIVEDDEGASYWGDRDCWAMYNNAIEQIKSTIKRTT